MSESDSLGWTAVVVMAATTLSLFILDDAATSGIYAVAIPTMIYLAGRHLLVERRESKADDS